MNVAIVGFGNAGGKIADRFLRYEAETARSLCRFVLAVNTAKIDLAKLERIPESNRLLVGQTNERVKGRGVGADPDLGATVTRQDRAEIERALDDLPIHDVDAFLVIAGLGGGTGSGGAPVLSRRLRETYAEPVYGIGVLPGEDEGGRPALNAARSLRSLADATDNLLLFDNEAWQGAGDTVEGGYERTNSELVRRFATLFSAGELDGSVISEAAVDSSDIRRTLDTGGVSTVAYATADLEPGTRRGLLDRFRVDGEADADHATKVYGLVRKAVRSRLTCPADVSSTERSCIVVSGPPAELSRKGLQRAREWVETETGSSEVLAGDDPREDLDHVAAVVVLSNVTTVDRIKALQEQGVDAQSSIEEHEAQRRERIEDLLTDEGNRLDPL
ncbi:MAG: tubulin/FtsZ family protein [Haloarculaceae archaeon]